VQSALLQVSPFRNAVSDQQRQCALRNVAVRGGRERAARPRPPAPTSKHASFKLLGSGVSCVLHVALALRDRARTSRSSLLADFVAKVEDRITLKISRKLIFGRLCCCVATQRHYRDPRSIFNETMWSLTSPLVKRISGSKNFRSSPQKDFCNNIGPNAKCRLRRATSDVGSKAEVICSYRVLFSLDPTRTLGSVILTGLFVRHLGQYKVFWISLGSYNLLSSCSSRRDVPMSPFHVDGRRVMSSAGIALPIKPTVFLRRSFTELSPCARAHDDSC
jgi:hypothetical protein